MRGRGSELAVKLSAMARAQYPSSPPERVYLLTQTIHVNTAENLHTPSEEGEHAHRAYGVYEEAPQRITLDAGLHFERQRETFLHENLHAMLAITGLDNLIEGEQTGLTEHVVTALAPIMLAWLRENHPVIAYLQEVQR